MLIIEPQLTVYLVGNDQKIVLASNFGQFLKLIWLVCQPCWVVRITDNKIFIFMFRIADIFAA